MTIEDVQKLVEEIRLIAEDDYKIAHIKENELHQAVLRELAKESPLAMEALKTLKIKFPRWRA